MTDMWLKDRHALACRALIDLNLNYCIQIRA